jgi:putative transposase
LRLAQERGWELDAWAVFSNHYHFVAHAPPDDSDASGLRNMIGFLQRRTATWVNRLDGAPGRRVWHNYWDTHLTFERSYLARLRYVHENAAHHGLVADARIYPYCSASWFEQVASTALYRTVTGFKLDRVNVGDAFDVHPDWR